MKLLALALLIAAAGCSSRSRAPEYNLDVETLRMYRERTPQADASQP